MWRGLERIPSFLGPGRKMFLASHVARKMETVSCFGTLLFHLLLHVRELPEFSYLLSLDRSKWPRCLLWHGSLPGLSCNGGRAPWAASFGHLASLELEGHLGAYPTDYSGHWSPPDFWDADDVALEIGPSQYLD